MIPRITESTRRFFGKGKSKQSPFNASGFRALIIGIDKYASEAIDNLQGAVADARAVYQYLTEELFVPADQIVLLTDKAARREAILRHLRNLGTLTTGKSPESSTANPILIYFAGHGTTAEAPDDWPTGHKRISMIIPYDAMFAVKYSKDFDVNTIRTRGTKRVYPIPDRTLGAILHTIAEEYGDNITVILDCCNSGSGTRDGERGLDRGVTMSDDEVIPPGLDEEIWGKVVQERATDVPRGFAKSGIRSHVLLAACREGERAREVNKCGVFTQELLIALRKCRTSTVTYEELMGILSKLPDQNPQCEGYHTDRVLFTAIAPTRGRMVHRVSYHDGSYTIQAGTIHGVTHNSKFSIHSHPNDSLRPLATMRALSVSSFYTRLELCTPVKPRKIPSPAFAFQLPVPGEDDVLNLDLCQIDRVLPHLRASIDRGKAGYPVTVNDKDPHIALELKRGRVRYKIRYPAIQDLGQNYLDLTTDLDPNSINTVLRSASHFFWHLRRVPPGAQVLRQKVSVHLHSMKLFDDQLDDHLRPTYKPMEPDLLDDGASVVDVVAGNTIYGIRLDNKSSRALHVWAFYFDCSDLTIMDYHMPSAVQTGYDAEVEPSLPGYGSLSIGYGPGGSQPFKYTLRNEQNADLGVIKIFLSTEAVDLRGLLQDSARTAQCTKPKGFMEGLDRGCVKESLPESRETWDTRTIFVRQRRSE
ncbi:unnamed protein product [Peniophora sp. CBMAI 1063]|nr:unnamed protein product [Peniophora sp. CBMAI 1063]